MLEIICTAIVKDGKKLYQHFKSIDHPLGRYFIIDNSCDKDPTVHEYINKILDNKPDYIEEISILKTHQNTGYPGAVNLAIKQNTDCNYWIFTGYDWYVNKGELAILASTINQHNNGMTLGLGDDEMCGVVFTPELIETVGLLDENYHPGYFEDNDYRYRQKLAGYQMSSFPLKAFHFTSSTLKSCEEFQKQNSITFAKNLSYYTDKWGGLPGNETFDSPFNTKNPITFWQYNPRRIQELRWI